MTDWKKVHGSQPYRPEELDLTSSQTTVYERRNITQETSIDEMSGEETTFWVYDERTYTREEYEALNSPTTQILMQTLSDIEVGLLELTI